MKLAFCLFHYFPFGGLEKDFLSILKECISRGHTIDVYTMTWEGDIPEHIQIFYIPQKGFTNHRQAKNFSDQLQKIFSQKKYDAIVGFNKIAGLTIYFAADHCFIKNISVWKRLLPRYKTYYQLEKSVFDPRASTKILALNEKQEQDFIDYYHTPKERFFLLSPHIDQEFKSVDNYAFKRNIIREELGLLPQDKMILMVASYFKTKGLDRALKAFSEIKTAAHLFIIGGDDPTPYLSFIQKAGIAQQVHFLGAQKNVIPYYIAADIFFHPAYREAGGKVLIEALAAGLPILTTDVCGHSPHIVAAKGGIVLSSPYNPIACQQALSLLLTQPLADYKKNARAYALSQNFYAFGETVADVIEGHA